jgi:hypothetical protein
MPNLRWSVASNEPGPFGITLSKERKKNALLFIGHSCSAESGQTRSSRQIYSTTLFIRTNGARRSNPIPNYQSSYAPQLSPCDLDTQLAQTSSTEPDKPQKRIRRCFLTLPNASFAVFINSALTRINPCKN